MIDDQFLFDCLNFVEHDFISTSSDEFTKLSIFSHGRLRGLKISNSFNPDSVLIFVRRDRHLIKDGLIFVMIDVAGNLNLSLFIFINEESFDRHQ